MSGDVSAKGQNHGFQQLCRGNAHPGRVVAKRGDDARTIVVGEKDSIPFVFVEHSSVGVVDRFECGQRPGTELRRAEIGVAKQGRVEVEDHVEFVPAVIYKRVSFEQGLCRSLHRRS